MGIDEINHKKDVNQGDGWKRSDEAGRSSCRPQSPAWMAVPATFAG